MKLIAWHDLRYGTHGCTCHRVTDYWRYWYGRDWFLEWMGERTVPVAETH